MKATIEITEDGDFTVEISSKKTHYKASGNLVLDEDAKDVREKCESLARSIIAMSSNYTQSKSTLNK